MSDEINIFILEKYPLLQSAFKSILEEREEIRIVGIGSTIEDLIPILREKKPDIIILNSLLSEGLWNSEIPELGEVKLILVSPEGFDPDTIKKAFQHNVKGYITIEISPEELIDTIKSVYAEEDYIAKEIMLEVFKDYALSHERNNIDTAGSLTYREKEILSFLSQGLSNREIAKVSNISEKTVKSHLTNIFGKLGVSSRLEAVLKVTKNNPAQGEKINPS